MTNIFQRGSNHQPANSSDVYTHFAWLTHDPDLSPPILNEMLLLYLASQLPSFASETSTRARQTMSNHHLCLKSTTNNNCPYSQRLSVVQSPKNTTWRFPIHGGTPTSHPYFLSGCSMKSTTNYTALGHLSHVVSIYGQSHMLKVPFIVAYTP